MSPYPEIVEIEGELTEVGLFADKSGYGVIITTDDGPVKISGMRDDDVDRLLPGIGCPVRITIDPIDDTESED